jgi:hypothetical protein
MTRRRAVTATQAAAAKATEAADSVMAWLRDQPGGGRQIEAAATPVVGLSREAVSAGPEPFARQANLGGPAGAAGPAPPAHHSHAGAPPPPRACALAHPDWLYHRLQIIGPATDLSAFRTSAAGAGTVPWQLDLDRVEEDLFHLLVAPQARSLSLSGARVLASQLCTAVAHRHALALAQVGQSRACPFDLHALVPVPDAILRHGPNDPEALSWLWAHWGTTQTLRHVTEDAASSAALARRATAGEAVWAVTFWSADWTPWRALAQIAAGWPTLRFDTRPIYDTP